MTRRAVLGENAMSPQTACLSAISCGDRTGVPSISCCWHGRLTGSLSLLNSRRAASLPSLLALSTRTRPTCFAALLALSVERLDTLRFRHSTTSSFVLPADYGSYCRQERLPTFLQLRGNCSADFASLSRRRLAGGMCITTFLNGQLSTPRTSTNDHKRARRTWPAGPPLHLHSAC